MKKDVISETRLTELLGQESFFSAAYCYECVSSTNDIAKELARAGAPCGTVVLAQSQTKGRGRMGRCFYSPDQSGLYMSLILRPDKQIRDAGLLTACGAVSVQQAIYDLTGVTVSVKWVNDLYYSEKKLCGILAEGQIAADGTFESVILGIGVNLSMPGGGYAEEISDIAISLEEICGKTIDPAELCAAIVRHWFSYYHELPETRFLEAYREHSCVLGKSVSFQKNGIIYSGKAVMIDDAARLIVELKNGEREVLGTGEVSLLRPIL